MDRQQFHILDADANRNFFKHVKNFSQLERPVAFNVRKLLPGKPDKEVAKQLAEYFIRVSREFDPLQDSEVPLPPARGPQLPVLQRYEVSARIKKMRKPKSMVRGDVFLQLEMGLADFFAMPLTDIYNSMARTGAWPDLWKQEFVAVTPKISLPESLSDLRNISCTMLARKIFESFVLDWLKAKVKLRPNQYEGIKVVGTDHVLVQM